MEQISSFLEKPAVSNRLTSFGNSTDKEPTEGLPYRLFRGFHIPAGSNEEHFRSAADYIPTPGDTLIVSYPKCGTTWMQHIVYLLKSGGVPANSIGDVVRAVPFVEQDGWPQKALSPIFALKYHLPLPLMVPLAEKARYIYVARNPKDACVSYYHFLKNLPGYQIKNFDWFFDAFVSGGLPYGDFFEHVVGWASARRHQNVLFITYESLHREREKAIIEISHFLGIPTNESTLRDVMEYSSFEFMRGLARRDNFLHGYLRASTGHGTDNDDNKEPVMMRRGVVGDWKNYFSVKQSRTMNNLLKIKTKGTDLLEMWKEDVNL